VSLVRLHLGVIFPVERLEVAGMVFREVSVIEVREVLRAWLAGKSERAVAAQAGVDRKTSRRYVEAAVAAGLSRGGGEGQLTDELIGQVVSVVRPVRPDGHGAGWAELEARCEQVTAWVEAGVPVVKIGVLLSRQGVVVAERTLHRFAAERCGAGGKKVTTPVDDGPPGGELQIDFGYLGMIPAGEGREGRRRKLHALVFTACFSRFMFVYLTFSMTLEEVIAGCEDAWAFFGGVFAVVVPDNMSPVVAKADAVNPRLTREWLEYAQARGFVTDPARVRHPRDKPRVAYCTSLGRFVRSSRSGWSGVLRPAAGLGAVGRAGGVGRVVEVLAFVVIPLGTDNSGSPPGLDRVRVDAVGGGGLGEGEHPGGAEPAAAAA
jgi:hypothetical protein